MRSTTCRAICFMLTCLWATSIQSGNAQDANSNQKTTAEKFLQLLIDRPQRGTALERTVEFYQSTNQLGELCRRLAATAEENSNNASDVAARHWIVLGLIYQTQDQWLESLVPLEKAINDDKHAFTARMAVAEAFENLQRWSDVVAVLQPLGPVTQIPRNKRSANDLLEFAKRLATGLSRTGKSAQALVVWKQLETMFPNDVPIAKRVARLAASEGELEFAEEVLQRALPKIKQPNDRTEVSVELAVLKARMGKRDLALTQFEELLLRSNPDSWLANDLRTRIESIVSDRDGAAGLSRYYESWLEKHPEDVSAMLRLADSLAAQSDWKVAETWFDKLLARTPNDVATRMAFARVLTASGQFDRAAQQYAQAAKLQPRNRDVLEKWGEVVFANMQLDESVRRRESLEIWLRMLQDSEQDPSRLVQVAELLERHLFVEQALDLYDQAVRVAPNELSYQQTQAKALSRTGNGSIALERLNAARKSQAGNLDGLVQLSETYKELKFTEEAIECLVEACQLRPTVQQRLLLSAWLLQEDRLGEAGKQVELAESELIEARLASGGLAEAEFEALLDDVMKQQLELLAANNSLESYARQLENSDSAQGLRKVIAIWKLALCRRALGDLPKALQGLIQANLLAPTNLLCMRLRAQIESDLKRHSEAADTYRKLAHLDMRRRNDYLLDAARSLASAKRFDEAMAIGEGLLARGAASAQQYISVFDLALAAGRPTQAVRLIEQRLQAKPDDLEALNRLINHLLQNEQFSAAAKRQWQVFELAATESQRHRAVEALINTHDRLKTMNQLEKNLDLFWRKRDLWREQNVWRVMIAVRQNNFDDAESGLASLGGMQETRQFAIEQAILVARGRGNALREFELLEQLATINPQLVAVKEVARCIRSIQGSSLTPDRIASSILIHSDLDRFCDLVDELNRTHFPAEAHKLLSHAPKEFQSTWQVLVRDALISLAVKDDQRLESACRKLLDGPLDLSDPKGQPQQILETLKNIQDRERTVSQIALAQRIGANNRNPNLGPISISAIAACQNPLSAYQIVLALELERLSTNEKRSEAIRQHKTNATSLADSQQATLRLVCLGLVAQWLKDAPRLESSGAQASTRFLGGAATQLRLTVPSVRHPGTSSGSMSITLPGDMPTAQVEQILRQYSQRNNGVQITAIVPNFHYTNSLTLGSGSGVQIVQTKQSQTQSDAQIVLAIVWKLSETRSELKQLAKKGDSLASLLVLHDCASRIGFSQPGDTAEAVDCWHNIGEFKNLVPSRCVALMALEQFTQGSPHYNEALATQTFLELANIDSGDDVIWLLQCVVSTNNRELIDKVVRLQTAKGGNVVDALGRSLTLQFMGLGGPAPNPMAYLHAYDSAWRWKQHATSGSIEKLQFLDQTSIPLWVTSQFDKSSISTRSHERFRASTLFGYEDFAGLEVLMAHAHSRKELNNEADSTVADSLCEAMRQLASQSASDELRLVRNLAHLTLLKHARHTKAAIDQLDEVLPANSTGVKRLFRALWLLLLDEHEIGLRELTDCSESPQDLPMALAADASRFLLEYSVESQSRESAQRAIKRLAQFGVDGNQTRSIVRRLINLLWLSEAEQLSANWIFRIEIAPFAKPNLPTASKGTTNEPVTDFSVISELLAKYKAAGDDESMHRLASRMLHSANDLPNETRNLEPALLTALLRKTFESEPRLIQFLEHDAARIKESNASMHECFLTARLLAIYGQIPLAMTLIERFDETAISPPDNIELAKILLNCQRTDDAVNCFVRAVTAQPDLLEAAAPQFNFSANPQFSVGVLSAVAADPLLSAAAGDKVAQCLSETLSSETLPRIKRLVTHWANNPTKRLDSMTSILVRLKPLDLPLWMKTVEQLLISDSIDESMLMAQPKGPGTSGLTSNTVPQLSGRPASLPLVPQAIGALGHLLLRPDLPAETQRLYVEMLQRVAQQRRDNIIPQLLLLNNAKLVGDIVTSNSVVAHMEAMAQGSSLIHPNRVRVVHEICGDIANNFHPEFPYERLLSLAKTWAGPQFLDPTCDPRIGLCVVYSRDPGAGAKLLALFDEMIGEELKSSGQRRLAITLRAGLSILQQSPMVFESTLLRARLMDLGWKDILDNSRQPEKITTAAYPLAAFVFNALAQADNDPNLLDNWQQLAIPRIRENDDALGDESHGFIKIVSLFESKSYSLHGIDQPRNKLIELFSEHLSKLEQLGPWQTLGLCELAMLLERDDTLQPILDRLLHFARETASTPSGKSDPDNWRVACWLAAHRQSDRRFNQQQFELGEIARKAMPDRPVRLAMALDQASAGAARQLELPAQLWRDIGQEAKQLGESDSLPRTRLSSKQPDTRAMSSMSKGRNARLLTAAFRKLVDFGQYREAIGALQRLSNFQNVEARIDGIHIQPLPFGAINIPGAPSMYSSEQFESLTSEVQKLVASKVEPSEVEEALSDLLFRSRGQSNFQPSGNPGLANFQRTRIVATATDSPRHSTLLLTDELPEMHTPLPDCPLETNLATLMADNALHVRGKDGGPNSRLKFSSRNANCCVVAGLLALQNNEVQEACKQLQQLMLIGATSDFRSEIEFLQNAIYRQVHRQPLSTDALIFKDSLLKHKANGYFSPFAEKLLLKQLALAIRNPDESFLMDQCKLLVDFEKRLPAGSSFSFYRLGERIALECLSLGQVGRALKVHSLRRAKLVDPDSVFRIALLRTLWSLPVDEQVAVFEQFFLPPSVENDSLLVWFDCIPIPDFVRPPDRFLPNMQASPYFDKLLKQGQRWLSFSDWIVSVARHTKKEAETVSRIRALQATLGNGLLVPLAVEMELDSELPLEDLRSRIQSIPKSTDLLQLANLISAIDKRPDIGRIVKPWLAESELGHVVTSISPSSQDGVPLRLKHWVSIVESDHRSSTTRDPNNSWSMKNDGSVQALPTTQTSYLMLRYPLRGEFQFQVEAEPQSDSKFGIGVGGISSVQHSDPKLIRYFGVGGRVLHNVAAMKLPELKQFQLGVGRDHKNSWIQQPVGRWTEESQGLSFLHLTNSGEGRVAYKNFSLDKEVSIADQVNLIDDQLRLWQVTLGEAVLPPLQNPMADKKYTTARIACKANKGFLSFRRQSDSAGRTCIQFLRPLDDGESVEYDFLQSNGRCSIHPVLGKLAVRFQEGTFQLQWLASAEVLAMMGLGSNQWLPLQPGELLGPIQVHDGWNRATVRMQNGNMCLEINGVKASCVQLPNDSERSFGFLYTPESNPSDLGNSVRNVILRGPWPASIKSQELMEPLPSNLINN